MGNARKLSQGVLLSWTTAERPSNPLPGQSGFNTTLGTPEWFDSQNNSWVKFSNDAFYASDALVVAGGGGSGASSSYLQTNVGNGGGGGGAGGSGIVVIRYPGAQRGIGGNVTSANGYTVHTFTSSGTYTA